MHDHTGTHEKFMIRDANGTIEVDKEYITSNSEWFYLSTTYKYEGNTYYEYLLRGTVVVPVYKYPRLRRLFGDDK